MNLKNEIAGYYNRFGPMVFRRCRKMLRNEENARDAMHEVFEKLLLYNQKIRPDQLSNLLFKISTNVCLNRIRADRIRKSVGDPTVLESIATYDESEERYVLRNLVDFIFIKEKQSSRYIAVMHYIEGMTLKEVAKEVGLSFGGVRKRLERLRERAKKLEVQNGK